MIACPFPRNKIKIYIYTMEEKKLSVEITKKDMSSHVQKIESPDMFNSKKGNDDSKM
jgi:hypothetical protein